MPAFLTWFAAGIFLALVEVLHRRGRGGRVTKALIGLARQPGSCWVAVLGLMLVSATPIAGPVLFAAAPTPAQSLTKHLLYYAAVGFRGADRRLRRPGEPLQPGDGPSAGAPARMDLLGIFCFHLPMLHLVMWLTGWQLFEGPAC